MLLKEDHGGYKMRKRLKEINGKRAHFTGTFERYGEKNTYMGGIATTVLLKDIKDDEGNIISDHLWFNNTKEFSKYNLSQGDILDFFARVKSYLKGYRGYREDVYKPVEYDYKLSYPTKVAKQSQGEERYYIERKRVKKHHTDGRRYVYVGGTAFPVK